MISSQQFTDSATLLNCEDACIRAVAEVEGGGVGFTTFDGEKRPIILFEPHIFYRELKAKGVTPVKSEICYPKWGEHLYPPGQKAQYDRLDQAAKIDREAALKSCSWGMFQILGSNYKSCGCDTLQEFINAMYKSEDEHLRLFCNLIRNWGLDKALQRKDWIAFAKAYNGPAYEKNKYHFKLNTAYIKYRS